MLLSQLECAVVEIVGEQSFDSMEVADGVCESACVGDGLFLRSLVVDDAVDAVEFLPSEESGFV